MFSMVLLEILSTVALFYSLLLTFLSFAPVESMVLMFTWTVAVSLFYYYSRKWTKLLYISALFLWAPLVFFHGGVALSFIFITTLLLLLYLERFLGRGSSQEWAASFWKVSLVYLGTLYLRWIMPGLEVAIELSAPFFLVCCLSSIVLIRSLRHMEAGMDPGRLQRSNTKYLLSITGIFFLVTLDGVREFIAQIARKGFKLLLLPIQWFLQVAEWLMGLLGNFDLKQETVPGEFELPGSEAIADPPPLEEVESVMGGNSILEKIFIALLICGTVFVLYKLIVRAGSRSYQGLDYVEEREYIKSREKRPKKRFRFRDKLPHNPGDQVRFYYRQFLKKLKAREVEVVKTDTTEKIQEKALRVYARGPEEIRGIYIASRYGDKDVDDATLAEMEQICKGL